MAILSDVDITKTLADGTITIEPKPQEIGPISVDLTLDSIYKTRTIPNPYKLYRNSHKHDHIFKIDIPKTPEPLQPIDDSWILKRFHIYLVKYHERVRFAKDTHMHYIVTMRSTAARQGIHSIFNSPMLDRTLTLYAPNCSLTPLTDMTDGHIYQLISSRISTRVKRGDKISQLVLIEPDTKYLSSLDILNSTIDDFGVVINGERKKLDLIVGGRGTTEDDIRSPNTIGGLALHLHPKVKYFKDDNSKNGRFYDRKFFRDLDLTKEKPPSVDGLHSRYFMVGRSSERYFIGKKYVGILPQQFVSPAKKPVNWGDALVQYINIKEAVQSTKDTKSVHGAGVHNSAPYILPGSEGYITFEIQPGSVVQPHMFIPLWLAPVKTPGKPYDNQLSKTDEIYLP